MSCTRVSIWLIGLLFVIVLASCRRNDDGTRVIHADVVALDHDIQYNRFGSHNPYGMIYALKRDVESSDGGEKLRPGKVRLRPTKRARPLVLRVHKGDILEVTFTNLLSPKRPERHPDDIEAEQHTPSLSASPATRYASIALSGLPVVDSGHNPKATGLQGIPPGATITYRWHAEREGTFLFASLAAPAGGEGNGGSLVHGLFGTVTVEPEHSSWYRSAVRAEELREAKRQAEAPALINYEVLDERGDPILNLLKPIGNNHFELIHSPLDAIIVEHDSGKSAREFTVIFHDELKTVYHKEFQILATNPQLVGVRDGFAINYGASGMGTILLANRLGIGPAKDCVDCLYEEFFLQSWANGDPALLPQYEDDPANVHHSYLGDPVIFRNSHAGPKETHVFHLHAHQWESSQSGYANYLDSQTIAPQQSFAYLVAHGASGNRNLTPGDAIFHCHLYPHFAQGMWALWRVHDVFEDGTRRLPDGEWGPGTDPRTGITVGGTPIPAVVPLPGRAIPPDPTYTDDPDPHKRVAKAFPGFPFYIPGRAGHRAPQPPLDIIEDGGLGRHIVVGGEREFNGGQTLAEQLTNADMTVHITRADLLLLPEQGTDLEQVAMEFHKEAAGHPSRTPEGESAVFRVNGKAPRSGAPFADPCGDPRASIRRYRVSVIDLDIQTNEQGWHDPQSRINVLDEDVARYEGKKTAAAEPFFFRVESGECVEFLHTNRAKGRLKRDDFQVATPTDTIGQHIHLVKFDVMASDGSGNGFNYEDGTLSWEAIKELAEASRFGVVKDYLGRIAPKPNAKRDQAGNPVFQTTIQRWWVDPHQHKDGDGTLGTVFTHDHFAPSSIQHHGFYNAMLVEPKGSVWRTPDGTDMKTGKRRLPGGSEQIVIGASHDHPCRPLPSPYIPEPKRACVESYAVGSRGMVVKAEDRQKHPDTREFALAIADFALLYDAGQTQGPNLPEGMVGKVDTDVANYYAAYRQQHGYPVDPPTMPEAISTDHHNPYLVNYKHEPIPLRIGERDSQGHFSRLLAGDCPGHLDNPEADRPTLCRPSDLAYVFSSLAPHGDPFLRPFRAYEGDRVQLRVVQGAQEVQHSFTLHGLAWRREAKNPDAPWVNAQEIGISEHFELDTVNLANIGAGLGTADYLFHFGSQDDLWNGGWGLLRAFASPEVFDPAACEDKRGILKVGQVDLLEAGAPDKDPIERQPFLDKLRRAGCTDRPVSQQYLEGPGSCPDGGRSDDRCALAVLDANEDGRVSDPQAGRLVAEDGCPTDAPHTLYKVEAWQVKDLLNDPKGMSYDLGHPLYDPDGLAFVLAGDVAAIRSGAKPLAPLVLRLRAGHCAVVELTSRLPSHPSDRPGDALMPRIARINVDEHNEGLLDAPPSNRVSLHPQLVTVDVNSGNGVAAGLNSINRALAVPGETKTYRWYAGRFRIDRSAGEEKLVLEPFTKPLVAGLSSFGDVIGQVSHGLVGALVIEPANARLFDPKDFSIDGVGRPRGTEIPFERASDLSLVVWQDDLKGYAREFVVLYQDGLNLDYNGQPVPDCRICDDSYDLGEQGVNYRSAPFWVRMGLLPKPNSQGQETQDLNDWVFPPEFYTEGHLPFPFADFTARAGERLRFLVVHPGGRARQHSFQVYGHSFTDEIPRFGSPWSRLITPGGAWVVEVERARPGVWMYRDGPAHLLAGGIWGRLVVEN